MEDKASLKKTSLTTGFDSVFVEVFSEDLKLNNPNCLRIFSLEMQNNSFSHIGLHQFLQKNIGRYVFSRASIENFYLNDDAEAISAKALELLRKASNPKDKGAGGELGEILLYIFLEQKLNAPKLLSKIELKTVDNQYVFGSDGVHLLSCMNDVSGDPFCQLILGESKIIGDLNSAIDDAFSSIEKVIKKPDNELRLIESNVFKEAFNETTAEYIKRLIIPAKRDLKLSVDKAFGVFLGYSIGIDSTNLSNSAYRATVQQKMVNDIKASSTYIASKITDKKLDAYSFYFYVLPFDNASKDRADIINKLKGE